MGEFLLAFNGVLLILQAQSLQILLQNMFLGKGKLSPWKVFIFQLLLSFLIRHNGCFYHLPSTQ